MWRFWLVATTLGFLYVETSDPCFADLIGEIRMTTSSSVPEGWLRLDGGTYSATEHPELFAATGATTLYDMRGRAAVGVGMNGASTYSPGSTAGQDSIALSVSNLPSHSHNYSLGQTTSSVGANQSFSLMQRSLATTYLIRSSGPNAGSVTSYAGTSAPSGWLLADGSSFSNTALPELFGALGSSTLPDLRGRVAAGASFSNPVGTSFGSNTTTLSTSQLPAHDHGSHPTFGDTSDVGAGADILLAQASVALNPIIQTAGTEAGLIRWTASSTIPADWLLLDGGTFSEVMFPELFAAIGTNTLPDMRGLIGLGTDGDLGALTGQMALQMSLDQMPSHFHLDPALGMTDSAGNGAAFSLKQPSRSVHFLVRAKLTAAPEPSSGVALVLVLSCFCGYRRRV